MPQPSAKRRYNQTVLWLSALYAAALLAATALFQHHALSGVLAYVAAIAPALPIVGIFWAIGRYLVEEQDEYIRMLMVRKSLIATAFAISVATVWGFLESFRMVHHIPAYYVAVLWFAGLGLGEATRCLQRPADA